MNRAAGWRRRVARTLLRRGAALLPAQRSAWAEVMRLEAEHIDDEREALDWALGALRACVTEALRDARLQRLFSAHSLGVMWIVIFVVSSAFNMGLALAARLGYARILAVLGGWMKDFHDDEFMRYAAAIPSGLFVLMGVVVALFAVSLNLNWRRNPRAFTTFCCALALSLAAWLYQLNIPAYVQAMSAPHRWRIGACFVLTSAVLAALRMLGTAPTPSMPGPPGGLP